MEILKYDEGEEYYDPNKITERVRLFYPKNFSQDKEIRIGWETDGPGIKENLHTHKTLEVMILVKGEGKWFTNDREYSLKPVSVIFVPSGEPHGYENISQKENLEFIFIYAPAGAEEDIRQVWKRAK